MKKDITSILLVVLFVLFGLWLFFLQEPLLLAQQEINDTWTANTTVNVTNSATLITAIALDHPIDLTAYDTTTVYCNVTTRDYDNDSLIVNATLYLQGTSDAADPDVGVSHYSNTSCQNTSVQNEYMNWTCSFEVQYYATNSTAWVCNITAYDTISSPNTNLSNNATVNSLVALTMPAVMDYGQLTSGDISNDTLGNITNAGNRDINISVYGYGSSPLDGFSFVCDTGNIPIANERYNITNSSDYTFMTQLTGSDTDIADFYVPRQLVDNVEVTNYTYWQIQIPLGVAGICRGKIVFTASDRYG